MIAADLLNERGKHGLHHLVLQYLEAEGCLVFDLTKGERELKRNPHGKGKPDLLVIVPAFREWLPMPRAGWNWRHGTGPYRMELATVLALELKRPRRGRISLTQKIFAELCHEIGLPHAFITSLDDMKRILPPKMENRK